MREGEDVVLFAFEQVVTYSDTDSFCPAQDPTSEPVRVTEGVLPITLNREVFYVTGDSWATFQTLHPTFSFDEFWVIKLHTYEKRNAAVKAFFAEFDSDPVRRA